MRVWLTREEEHPPAMGVARAVLSGADRDALLQHALSELLSHSPVERAGIWLLAVPSDAREAQGNTMLRGVIGEGSGLAMPAEWKKFSAEEVLPQDLLIFGKTIAQELDELPNATIIGPTVELRRVLWAPVQKDGHLRGVIMAGSRKRNAALPRHAVEAVAAELTLALELADQQRVAREGQADAFLAKSVLARMESADPAGAILEQLVENCTECASQSAAPEFVFAAVASLEYAEDGDSGSSRAHPMFLWKSGAPNWLDAIASEPLAKIWRRALEMRTVVGSEPAVSWAHGEVSRVVALPLENAGRPLGVLVAGLRPGSVSHATLERLELRAVLASAALARLQRVETEKVQNMWQRQLLDAGGDAVLVVDTQGMIVQRSRGARNLLEEMRSHGAAPMAESMEAAEQIPFIQLFCAREQTRVAQWLRRSFSGQRQSRAATSEHLEAELSNGVRVRGLPPAPAGGAFATLHLEPCLTSEQSKRSERAEVELRSVIEWLEEGVVLFDDQENVRAMNTRFAQIVGLAPGETEAVHSLDRLVARLGEQAAEPQQFRQRWKNLAHSLEGGVREEFTLLGPASRVLERAARPVLDDVGRQLGRVEIYRDLTAHRTFQAKLLQTEKLAALGQMLTGIAHELSNPLTTILGYAQRLLLQKENADSVSELRQILQEAERASTILRQLLLNAREHVSERRLVSLNQIVNRALELQHFSMTAEKIRIELDLDPLLPLVHGDAGQLQQILMNLVGNARQAIDQQAQGGVIRLHTKRVGENRVMLEVTDTGPGIPPAILARIFDPFFTTKPPGEGTGLGLSIVLSIVREHGGQVHAASPPTGGAVFTIELPTATARVSEQTPDSVDGRAVGALQAPRKPLRPPNFLPSERAPHAPDSSGHILVVEDEPTVARLIADVLEDARFKVDVLLDGRQAVARASRGHYDLIICDMKMPGFDGQNFYKSLQNSSIHLPRPFLFVTGDVVSSHTREFLERTKTPHLAKPFRIEELSEKVLDVLGRTGPQNIVALPDKSTAARNG